MKNLIVITAILLLSSVAFASDEWFCSSESSARNGDVIKACGVGEGSSETEARESATKAAKSEFHLLCDDDTNCNGHAVEVKPMRQTCSKSSDGYKCYRMLEYTISPDLKKDVVEKKVAGSLPKIFKGMSKEDLIAAFGTPDVYLSVDDRYLILNYVNKDFCDSRCTIGLNNDSVYKFDGFKIEYTTLLEKKSFLQKLLVGI